MVFEDSGGPDVDVVLVLVFGALETFVDVLYGRSSVVQEQGAFPGRVVDVLPGKVELQGPAPLSPALSDDVSGACDVQTADWSSIVSHVRREENRERDKLAKLLLVANVMFYPWPAMRVISLGIRTVPVLSVAKKLAAPRPTPTAPAAKCGLIRQDEAD